jgi:hypothetical protein
MNFFKKKKKKKKKKKSANLAICGNRRNCTAKASMIGKFWGPNWFLVEAYRTAMAVAVLLMAQGIQEKHKREGRLEREEKRRARR